MSDIIQEFFGPKYAEALELTSGANIDQLGGLLRRDREINKNHRDEWDNWDGTFAQDRAKLRIPEVDHHFKKKQSWNWGGRGSFCFLLTHDIDTLNPFSWKERLRSAVRRECKNRIQKVGGVVRRMVNQNKAPWHLQKWVELVSSYGFRSTWFVFPDGPEPAANEDCSYRWFDLVSWEPGNWIPFLEGLDRLVDNGFEVGLHGSYYSASNSHLLISQKQQLEEALGTSVRSTRQHYLRYDPIQTPGIQAESGFEFDSTMGMNREIGFRTGTSFPHFQWDPTKKRISSVLEFPLAIQDGALFSSNTLNLGLKEATTIALSTMDQVERVGGCFTLLFHPDGQTDPRCWALVNTLLAEARRRGAWGPTISQAGDVWLGQLGD